MRAVSGIVLVVLLLMQSVGTHVLFQVQRLAIRKEIKRTIKKGVPENELTYFALPVKNDGLQWLNDHEFVIKGCMYDVVWRKELPGDSVRLACISDDDETRLFAQLNHQVQDVWNSPEQQQNHQQLILSLSSPYVPATSISIYSESTFPVKIKPDYSRQMLHTYGESVTPPPEFPFFI